MLLQSTILQLFQAQCTELQTAQAVGISTCEDNSASHLGVDQGQYYNLLSSAGLRGTSDASAEKGVTAPSDLIRST